jgi:hypothetical protein
MVEDGRSELSDSDLRPQPVPSRLQVDRVLRSPFAPACGPNPPALDGRSKTDVVLERYPMNENNMDERLILTNT